MNIILYKNSSPDNTINKNLEKIITLEGTLRASTSIINPTINVELVEGQSLITDNTEQYVADDLNQLIGCVNISDIYSCNYAYIPEFKRYYFIIDISTNQNFIFTFKMKCDVLESYKDNIYNLRGLVARNAKWYNNRIRDDLLLTDQNTTQENIYITYYKGAIKGNYGTEPNLSFVNKNFSLYSGHDTIKDPQVHRYILTLAVLPKASETDFDLNYKEPLKNKNGDELLINYSTNSNNKTISNDVTSNSPFIVNYLLTHEEVGALAKIFNTTSSLTDNANQQCVISLISLPFNLESFSGNEVNIRYGETTSSQTALSFPKIINDICVADFTLTDYKAYSIEQFTIYSKFEIMLPFYGFVELKYEQIIDRRLVVLYNINVGTTSGYVRIVDITNSNNGTEIFYADVEIGIDVTLNFNNAKEYKRNQIINAINLGVSGLGSALFFSTALASSGMSSMALTTKGISMGTSGLANNVNSVMNNTKNYTTKIGKSNNGISQYEVFIRVTKPSFTNRTDDLRIYCGLPLNEYETLSSLKGGGFTQLDNITISNMNATKEERNEIKELLESGVYL